MDYLNKRFGSLLKIVAVIVFALQSHSAFARDDNYTYAGADLNYSNLRALGETYNPINLRGKLGVVLLLDIIPVLVLCSAVVPPVRESPGREP